MSEKKEMEFKMVAVNEKPPRRYRTGSMFDPLLDAFVEQGLKLVKVTISGDRSPDSVTAQIRNIIKTRKLNLQFSTINGEYYLETTEE